MIGVKNKKAISNISRKSLIANRTRNVVAICAIALTSVLFTSLFTIGGSMLKTMELSTCRQVGTEAHAGYKFITEEQYEKIKTHPSIKDVSYNIFLSTADNPELSKQATEIRYSEDKDAKWSFCYPETGAMPKEYNDLATSTIVLDALKIPHELGQEVPLDFTVRGKTYHETFRLCGFWKGDSIAMAQEVWLSKDYVLDAASTSDIPLYERSDNDYSGLISCSIWFNSTFNIEKKITKVTTDSGYDPSLVNQGVNWAYGGAEVDKTTVVLIIMVLLLIAASGYLIIYNVFYISVTKDTRYYGLLKTIGTTGKQLRTIVRKQALLLSCVGIPIGLLIGYGIGVLLLPLILSNTYYSGQGVVSMNPLVFALSALFSLATVLISCSKPAKLASRISPLEALRYFEESGKKRKRRGLKRITTFSMALSNVLRSRRKLTSVVLSLSLSLILVNSVYTIVTGFDMNKFLEDRIIADFSVCNSKLITKYELEYTNADTLSAISSMDGVAETGAVYFSENSHRLSDSAAANVQKIIDERLNKDYNEKYTSDCIRKFTDEKSCYAHIYGIDKLIFDKLKVLGGEADYGKFESGNYVYVSSYVDKGDYPYYRPGDKVTLDYGDGDTKKYTVLGIAFIPNPANCMHGHYIDPEFILPSTEYLSHDTVKAPLHVLCNAAPGRETEVSKAVEAYCDATQMTCVSKDSAAAEFHSMQSMILIVGGMLSAILGLIGILNFMNSILTSIISRRHELAMLQSVGMTFKQLRRMLIGEGFVYTFSALLAAFTMGNAVVFIVVKLFSGQIL
ncbi:MAG: FtsX-like permease family protein, partial [Oscillospiraceae bacterium]